MKKGIPGRINAKKRSTKKISPEARQLIRAALRQSRGSERGAAKLLRLSNHAQLGRMLRGEMSETPAMRAAVVRAKDRAKRAFLFQREQSVSVQDIERIRKMIAELDWALQVAKHIIG